MFKREFECPSCGGKIQKNIINSKSVICSYCGQSSHIQADSLEAAGNAHLLVDYGSIFHTNLRVQLGDQKFQILGRLRIEYDDGFWDEWYIQFDDGREAWIQEDDGSFTLFLRQDQTALYDDLFELVEVGHFHDLSPDFNHVFITSKSRASIVGGDGELPFRIKPGDPADFVDGIYDGQTISLEVLPEETILFLGQQYEVDDFII